MIFLSHMMIKAIEIGSMFSELRMILISFQKSFLIGKICSWFNGIWNYSVFVLIPNIINFILLFNVCSYLAFYVFFFPFLVNFVFYFAFLFLNYLMLPLLKLFRFRLKTCVYFLMGVTIYRCLLLE